MRKVLRQLSRAAVRRPVAALLCLVAGLPFLFVLASPLLALLGHLTELFSPRAVGDIDVLILLVGGVIVMLAGAVLAVVAAALAVVGTGIATIASLVAHIVSRLQR